MSPITLKSKLIPIDIATRNRFINHKINIIGVEIFLSDLYPSLKVWSCYIPSSSNILANLWQDLFVPVSHNTLLVGDLNAYHPAWGSDSMSSRGDQIYDSINSLGLCIMNDGCPSLDVLAQLIRLLIYPSVLPISPDTYHGEFLASLMAATISLLL